MSFAFSSLKSHNVKTVIVESGAKKERWALGHKDDAVRAEKCAGIALDRSQVNLKGDPGWWASQDQFKVRVLIRIIWLKTIKGSNSN